MPESKANLVVTAVPNPDGAEDMQAYLKGVLPVLMSHGGELVYRGKIERPISGEAGFAMLMVMAFDSAASIDKVFESAEYKALVPHREKGFSKIDILVSSPLG